MFEKFNEIKNTKKNLEIMTSLMDMVKYHLREENNIEMRSNAELCYKEACYIMFPAWSGKIGRINIGGAAGRARKSLMYSIGTFHGDYIKAREFISELS